MNSDKLILLYRSGDNQLRTNVDGTMTDGGVTLLSQTKDVALGTKAFDAHRDKVSHQPRPLCSCS